jgi:hypothetical protein
MGLSVQTNQNEHSTRRNSMSEKTVETILTRAMSDASFAETLFANPEKALAGYDLTSDEIANVKGMSRADFDKYSSVSPEERKSLGHGINHNETALFVHGSLTLNHNETALKIK